MLLRDRAVAIPSDGFFSWAALDRRDGRINGSANLNTQSDTLSMIKAWLAADDLRRLDEAGLAPDADRLMQLSTMIRDSDNPAANATFARVGRRAAIHRMIAMCGLTETAADEDRWSNTVVSARDVVRIGLCLADGRAAGKRWTPWLIGEMRAVRGTGDFGPRAALPAEHANRVAIKNGWLLRDTDGLWHVSCLAIGDGWVLGALARYPGDRGLAYGAGLCEQLGFELLLVA